MAHVARKLDRALVGAGIPIAGVSIGRVSDRATWRATFAPGATEKHRTEAAAIIGRFDPDAPDVVAADNAVTVTGQITPHVLAFHLFWFRETHGRDPSQAERGADMKALVAAFRDANAPGATGPPLVVAPTTPPVRVAP